MVAGAEVGEVAVAVDGVDTTVMMALMEPMALPAGTLLLMEMTETREATEEEEVVVVVEEEGEEKTGEEEWTMTAE